MPTSESLEPMNMTFFGKSIFANLTTQNIYINIPEQVIVLQRGEKTFMQDILWFKSGLSIHKLCDIKNQATLYIWCSGSSLVKW